MKSRQKAVLVGIVTASFVWLAQSFLVEYAYEGRWSALFYTGAASPLPPALAGEHVRRLPSGATGYDGQIYHIIAHDPWLQRGFSSYVDEPRLRYRRILVPAAAWLAAGGRDAFVDWAYRAWILFFVGLGAGGLAMWAAGQGKSAAWGAVFVLLPAVTVSAERMTVDVALAALCVFFARPRSGAQRYVVLLLAPLVRETGFLLTVAAAADALKRRNRGDLVRVALTALPALAWVLYVHAHTSAFEYSSDWMPLQGLARAFFVPEEPRRYWIGHLLRTIVTPTALVGILAALILGLLKLRRPLRGVDWACVAFAVAGVCIQRADNWTSAYDYGRVYSPLLLWLGMDGLSQRDWRLLIPWALVEMRILLQLAGPVGDAVHGLLSL